MPQIKINFKPLFWEALSLFIVVIILHCMASAYHLYWKIYEFDSILHFLGGATLSLFFLWLYFYSGLFKPRNRKLKDFIVIALLGSVSIALFWEIYELIFKRYMVQISDYPYDLTMDLIMDVLGASVGFLYGYMRELEILKGEKTKNNEQS